MDESSPAANYQTRLTARIHALQSAERAYRVLGNWRLAIFLVAAAQIWLIVTSSRLPAWTIAIPGVAFLALVIWHERIARDKARADRAVTFYRLGVSRLDGTWAGQGRSGEEFRDLKHLYAEDLDLFGPGSLFELLSTARTRMGESTLARWLLEPAGAGEIRKRQGAVGELAKRPDLREDLAVLGDEVRAQFSAPVLLAWKRQGRVAFPRWARLMAAVLSLLAPATLIGAIWAGWPPRLAFAALVAECGCALVFRSRVRVILSSVDFPARELGLLVGMVERVLRERFESPGARELTASLRGAGVEAPKRIRQLHRLVALLDSRRNQLFFPVAALLLWGTQIAMAIDAWQRDNADAIEGWIEAIGAFEALSALATYAYEHPDDTAPDLVDGPGMFAAEDLGHPLLDDGGVRNDVNLGSATRLWVVSGSNMSGKSTLLRAVGTAVVMAQAGGMVRARKVRLSPLAIGASMRLHDSLQEGASRFYAEINRIRAILGLATEGRPVVFLLDELLSGTNSHDRQIGAEAIVTTLVERGAIGLVTTHDLALAEVATRLAPHGLNVHFEDRILEGRVAFDYLLRPGVVERSNALALMRAIGIQVEE